ncbi:MAG: hypothetical protein Fur0046_14640 [Cyanobacteria bacterium J069]
MHTFKAGETGSCRYEIKTSAYRYNKPIWQLSMDGNKLMAINYGNKFMTQALMV